MYYAGSRLPSLGNALQGDFLQAFNPEISPEDSFTDIEEQALISPVSPTASPPLSGVTTRQRSSHRGSNLTQLWQDAFEAPMPTAGPLLLEDVPALQLLNMPTVPVTGSKRPRSPGGSTTADSLAEALDEVAEAANIPPFRTRKYAPPGKLSRHPRKRFK